MPHVLVNGGGGGRRKSILGARGPTCLMILDADFNPVLSAIP